MSTVVRPTAGEFFSSTDVKMGNWNAAEIQEMLASVVSVAVFVVCLLL